MSNRARVKKPFYLPVTTSLGATFQGTWLNVEGVDNFSFDVSWLSSDAVGTFTVQGNNEEFAVDASTRQENPSGRLGNTPPTIATAATNPASNNGRVFIPLVDSSVRWARLVYTRTSGTGTVGVAVCGKGL